MGVQASQDAPHHGSHPVARLPRHHPTTTPPSPHLPPLQAHHPSTAAAAAPSTAAAAAPSTRRRHTFIHNLAAAALLQPAWLIDRHHPCLHL